MVIRVVEADNELESSKTKIHNDNIISDTGGDGTNVWNKNPDLVISGTAKITS